MKNFKNENKYGNIKTEETYEGILLKTVDEEYRYYSEDDYSEDSSIADIIITGGYVSETSSTAKVNMSATCKNAYNIYIRLLNDDGTLLYSTGASATSISAQKTFVGAGTYIIESEVVSSKGGRKVRRAPLKVETSIGKQNRCDICDETGWISAAAKCTGCGAWQTHAAPIVFQYSYESESISTATINMTASCTNAVDMIMLQDAHLDTIRDNVNNGNMKKAYHPSFIEDVYDKTNVNVHDCGSGNGAVLEIDLTALDVENGRKYLITGFDATLFNEGETMELINEGNVYGQYSPVKPKYDKDGLYWETVDSYTVDSATNYSVIYKFVIPAMVKTANENVEFKVLFDGKVNPNIIEDWSGAHVAIWKRLGEEVKETDIITGCIRPGYGDSVSLTYNGNESVGFYVAVSGMSSMPVEVQIIHNK